MLTEAQLTREAIRSLAAEGRPIRVAVVARFLKARRSWLLRRCKDGKNETYLHVWSVLNRESAGILKRSDFYQAWISVFGRTGVKDPAAVSHREVAAAIAKIVETLPPGVTRRQACAAIKEPLSQFFPSRTISRKSFWHGWDAFCIENPMAFQPARTDGAQTRVLSSAPLPAQAILPCPAAVIPPASSAKAAASLPSAVSQAPTERIPDPAGALPVTHTDGLFPSNYEDAVGNDSAWPFALRPWEALTKKHGGVLRIPDDELAALLGMLTKIDPEYLVDCGGGLSSIRANHLKSKGLPRDYVSPEALAEREYWRRHGRT